MLEKVKNNENDGIWTKLMIIVKDSYILGASNCVEPWSTVDKKVLYCTKPNQTKRLIQGYKTAFVADGFLKFQFQSVSHLKMEKETNKTHYTCSVVDSKRSDTVRALGN